MLDVLVVSPRKIIFEGRTESIILPGEHGVFEILPFHKPLLGRLVRGNLIVDEQVLPIRRGIVGVNHNKVNVIIVEE